MSDTTKVIFRRFASGEILALFPDHDEGEVGMCSSYMHVGQHSMADFMGCVSTTEPAKPREYKSLKVELESIGYNLLIKR